MDGFPPGMDEKETAHSCGLDTRASCQWAHNFNRIIKAAPGLSHPMLVYFFSFLGLFLLACVFGGTRASFLLIPRVSTDSHNVPVRPRRKSDHLQDNCHTNFLPAMGMGFSWSPQPSTDCAARTSTDF